jgi:protocatechuate 3,4-dioxygenase beta subunit
MIRQLLLFAPLLLGTGPIGCFQEGTQSSKPIGGPCEDCELMFEGMPKTLGFQTAIAEESEPGERLEMRGVVYERDGKTPAPDVVVYVYHTDAKGYYSRAPGQSHGLRHGHLRGWVKSDKEGRYEFRTIRPAPYPNGDIPAHIHAIVKEPGKNEYWVDDYLFEDDPLLTKEKHAVLEDRGGSGIVKLSRNPEGVWIGRRDFVLGRNIPGYR